MGTAVFLRPTSFVQTSVAADVNIFDVKTRTVCKTPSGVKLILFH